MVRVVMTSLLLVAAATAIGCEALALSRDSRPKTEIREDTGALKAQLTGKRAELARLQTRLIEEGWSYNYASEFVPPRGMDPGGQVEASQTRFRNLQNEIADVENRLDWNRRLWMHRHYDVAELTRDAAAGTTGAGHIH